MLFNIHHGQMRVGAIPGKGRAMVFRPKNPQKLLQMQDWDAKGPKARVEYRADALGNIDVLHPKHIETMVGLGYPLYDGDGKLAPVPMDDLLYPTLELNSEYWKQINRALKRKMTNG